MKNTMKTLTIEEMEKSQAAVRSIIPPEERSVKDREVDLQLVRLSRRKTISR